MDDYRKIQKKMCNDGGNSKGTYGCYCCRKIRDVRDFKIWSRRLAKVRLRREDRSVLPEDAA